MIMVKLEIVYVLCSFIINSCLCYPNLFQITEPTDHAEGPSWDEGKQILYYVDIPLGKIFAYHFKTKQVNSVQLPGQLTPVISSKYNPETLIIGLNRTVAAVNWNGKDNKVKSFRKIVTVSPQFPNSRFNDGKADSKGRLWFGTMANETPDGYIAPNEGVLYRIDGDKRVQVMIAPVNISNGLAWSKDDTRFFYIDSPTRRVLQYDYDSAEGTLKNQRVCFDLAWYPSILGVPDGMTIDVDDKLWIALYGGGGVIQVDPKKGKVLQFVVLPAKHVTSVMWGGPKYKILFVTTSRKDLKGADRLLEPTAGSVFGISNLGTSGLKVFDANIL